MNIDSRDVVVPADPIALYARKERLYMGEQTYIFLGWAKGNSEIQDGERKGEKRPYFNIYVYSPVSDYKSEDYCATGFKAEKKSCVSDAVWKDLSIGEEIALYFNEKNKVVLATSTGRSCEPFAFDE